MLLLHANFMFPEPEDSVYLVVWNSPPNKPYVFESWTAGIDPETLCFPKIILTYYIKLFYLLAQFVQPRKLTAFFGVEKQRFVFRVHIRTYFFEETNNKHCLTIVIAVIARNSGSVLAINAFLFQTDSLLYQNSANFYCICPCFWKY